MPTNSYQLKEEIGSGNYGSVHRGILQLSAVSATVKKYQQYMIAEGKSLITVAVKTNKGALLILFLHSVYLVYNVTCQNFEC